SRRRESALVRKSQVHPQWRIGRRKKTPRGSKSVINFKGNVGGRAPWRLAQFDRSDLEPHLPRRCSEYLVQRVAGHGQSTSDDGQGQRENSSSRQEQPLP